MGDPPDDNEDDQDQDQDQDPDQNQNQNLHAQRTTLEILPPFGTATATLSPLQSDNWADSLPSTDHVRFFKSTDWASTRMGPLAGWSTALRLYTFMVLADSRAACVYWRVFSQSYPTRDKV